MPPWMHARTPTRTHACTHHTHTRMHTDKRTSVADRSCERGGRSGWEREVARTGPVATAPSSPSPRLAGRWQSAAAMRAPPAQPSARPVPSQGRIRQGAGKGIDQSVTQYARANARRLQATIREKNHLDISIAVEENAVEENDLVRRMCFGLDKAWVQHPTRVHEHSVRCSVGTRHVWCVQGA